MFSVFRAAMTVGAVLLVSGAHAETPSPAGPVFDVEASRQISRATLVERLAEADVVILGEYHDNPQAHIWQAKLVEELDAARGVGGLAFEMFGVDREAAANAHRAEGKPVLELEGVLGWENWPDFEMYAPIFSAAPDAHLTGGAVPRGDLMRLAMSPEQSPLAERFKLAEPLADEEQAKREAGQAAAHCFALPDDILPGMVTAQRLRDASFADALLRAHDEAGDKLAVLITGNGHARTDWGVPRDVATASPELETLSYGIVEVSEQQLQKTYAEVFDEAPPYDFVVVLEAFDRGDPCDAFKQ